MNFKRTTALAAFAALVLNVTPAFAASPTITVKWDTQALSSIVLTTQYSNTGVHVATAEPILANLNGGSGICQASDTEAVTGTVNFGNVTPDLTLATDCMEQNAVNAVVQTNDSLGYTVAESATSGYPAASYLICLLPNGTYANNLAVTASTHASAPLITSTTACGAGNYNMDNTGATLLSPTAATTGTNLGGDIELVIGANAPTGAASVVETYTLVTK